MTETVSTQTSQVGIFFSETVIGAGNTSNYQLQSVGPDGLLGTADDVIWPLSVSVSGTIAFLTLPELSEGIYRLTVHDSITTSTASRSTATATARPAATGFRISSWFRRAALVLRRTDHEFRRFHAVHGRRRRFQRRRPARSGRHQLRRQLGVGVFGQRVGGDAAPVTFSSGGTSPSKIVTADFNGDGNLDLAVANTLSNAVNIFLGDGKGDFIPGTSSTSARSPTIWPWPISTRTRFPIWPW